LTTRSKALALSLTRFEVQFHRFAGAQIFIYKGLPISSSKKCFDDGTATEQRERGLCAIDTKTLITNY